jgi:hypothetical protein
MAAPARRNPRARQAGGLALCVSLLLVMSSGTPCFGSGIGLTVLGAHAPGWTEPRLIKLSPGTELDAEPPKGWTHLVIKSVPRLASGDSDSLPSGSSETATMFRTAIVADVQPADQDEKDFVLARIGVGMCIPHQEHDMVVSSDRVDALGLRLSMVERMVLDAAEAELSEGRLIARTATFGLFRAPANLLVNGKHRRILLYYAFCVERTTGQLCVGVWAMAPESETQHPPQALVKLKEDPVYDCQLDVHAKRLLNTIPYSWSFAMRSLPPGRTVRVPAPLGKQIVAMVRHPLDADPEELERALMTILYDPQPAKTTVRHTAVPPPHRKAPAP